MKIKYKFADGTVSEVEVSEEIGEVILESRRIEENLARKERSHCYSIDSIKYGDSDIHTPANIITPLDEILRADENSELYEAFHQLTETQQRRLYKLSLGMSIREIARSEGTDHSTIRESLEGARKKFQRIYKNSPPKKGMKSP